VKRAYDIIRQSVPVTDKDRSMAGDIETIVGLIRDDHFESIL